MSTDFQRYLVDNNALFQLPKSSRTAAQFREVARFVSEVLHETGDYADLYDLAPLEFKTTAAVLKHLKTVMGHVEPGDFDLVNLYAGEGCADPLLVACALDGQERRERMLVGETWTVVTGDLPVRDACDRHQIEWIATETLLERLAAD